MVLNDTQKIYYLLSAIRHERSLALVYSQIQTSQVRDNISMKQACDDLRYRCEAMRADDLLHTAIQPHKVRGLLANGETPSSMPSLDPPGPAPQALITTAAKQQNRGAPRQDPVPCAAKDCGTLTQPHLRLCYVRKLFANIITNNVIKCDSKCHSMEES
jgi:hypothetical protein